MLLSKKILYKSILLYANKKIWNLIQKHPECKKRSGQELEKGQDEKELKSKWTAKAGVVLVLMRINFNNHKGRKILTFFKFLAAPFFTLRVFLN